MNTGVTHPERQVLPYLQNKGEPSCKAIAEHFHINRATAYKWIKTLELEGYLVTGIILKDFIITLTDEGAEYEAPQELQPADLLPCGHSKAAADRLGFCLPCHNEQRRDYCKDHKANLTLTRVQMSAGRAMK
jgi:hypothetical protein